MISQTIQLGASYPAKIIYNYQILLKLNPELYKSLPMRDRYLLLEKLQEHADILDNVSPQARDYKKNGESVN